MVKMRRRADYHPLEIVVKAAFMLLIVVETNGKSMGPLEDSTLEKFLSLFRSRIHPSYGSDRPNPPIWYYPPYSHRIQPEKDHMKNDRIYYPDEFVPLRFPTRINTIEHPPKCEGTTYCESTSYYPTDEVDRLLIKYQNLRNLAVVDTLVTDQVAVGQRIDAGDESPLCPSIERVVYPTTAESARGDGWLWVAQSEKLNFTQGVRVENCQQDGAECDIIGKSLPSSYVSHCTQRYVVRDLVVKAKDGSLSKESLRLPSSCCCGLTLTGRRRRSPKNKKTDDTI